MEYWRNWWRRWCGNRIVCTFEKKKHVMPSKRNYFILYLMFFCQLVLRLAIRLFNLIESQTGWNNSWSDHYGLSWINAVMRLRPQNIEGIIFSLGRIWTVAPLEPTASVLPMNFYLNCILISRWLWIDNQGWRVKILSSEPWYSKERC